MADYAPSRNMVSSVTAACKAEASSSCAKMPAYSAILVLFLDAILVASIFLALDLVGHLIIMGMALALGILLALAAVLAGAGIRALPPLGIL
jgi:hypothetical protein